jgi:hypothetical protein
LTVTGWRLGSERLTVKTALAVPRFPSAAVVLLIESTGPSLSRMVA